jgi:pimeloyl-ACP methyl ester carboxylesterase
VEQYAAVLYDRHPLARRELLYWVATATSRRAASGTVQLKYDPEVLSSRNRSIVREISSGVLDEAWQLLAALSCPVLVLRGAASSVLSLPIASKMTNSVLKHGAYRAIPLSGHSIQLDNPDAVAAAIEQFIHPGAGTAAQL